MKAFKLVVLLLAFAGGAGSALASDAASADYIVVASGATTMRLEHIEVAGSSLSSIDLAALFDTKDLKVLEGRLRKLDAATITIPELTGETIRDTGTSRFAQKQILLTDVHGGRASTGSAAAATVTIKNGTTDTMITIGAATFKGLDLAQIVHLATGPRLDDSEAPNPFADEIALQTVTVGAAIKEERPTVIAMVRGTKLKGRPLGPEFGAGPDDGTRVAASLNDIAHSFSADLIEASGFALVGPISASTKGLKSLALGNVAVHGLGDGKLARFALSGLAIEGNERQPGRLALASAEIDDITTNATTVPSIDKVDLHDFVLDVPTGDKTGAHFAVSVAHAGYTAPGLVVGRLPAKATLTVDHAAFDVPPGSAGGPMLLAMGYPHLDVSSQSVSRYDAAGQKLEIDPLSLTGAGMGTLDLKLDLAKVSEAIVSQNDADQKAATAAILVKTLDLALHNDGLIDKAIAYKATMDGVTIEVERANLAQLVDFGVLGVGLQGSAKVQLIVTALHKFIADPKTLHIALTSREGLGATAFSTMASPQALLDAIEVAASANE